MPTHLDPQTVLQSIVELRASQTKTDEQLRKTDEQLARTDAKLERIGQQLANIGFSNGDAAEDFFYSSLANKCKLGKINFDDIERNVRKKRKRLKDEYDIFLKNGDCVALIEVKYKVKHEHIAALTTRKVCNFRQLFPDYAHFKIYTGIAGMSFEPGTEDFAHEEGVAILKQKGDHMEVDATDMRAF